MLRPCCRGANRRREETGGQESEEKTESLVRTSCTTRNSNEADWSWDCVSAIDARGRTIWIVDVHRRADELLTAFVELQMAIHEFAVELCVLGENVHEN